MIVADDRAPKLICSHCLAENGQEQPRCHGCGALLAEAALAAGDEIRQAAVLFADVADFTSLSARLPLDRIKQLMDQLFERLYQVVLDHGGVVDKYIGDCLMALFGVPLARGEDGLQAVRAALAMQRAVRALAPELQRQGLPAVRLRVATNAGPVIAGLVGAGPQRRYTVMGPVVNAAAHLQQAAPVGGVVIGEGSYLEAKALFHLEALQTTAGRAYLVRAERFGSRWLSPRGLFGAGGEMVGREELLARVEALSLAAWRTPRPRLALLVGRAGIGKTRVAFEFLARQADSDPPLTLVGHAHPLARGTPFSLVADVLRRKLDLSSDPEARSRSIAALLSLVGQRAGPAELETLEAICEPPARPADTPGGAERFLHRAFDLLARLLAHLASRKPVICVLDDVHHADGASLQLLGYLLRRLERLPVFLLATARSEFLEQHPELAHAEAVETIELAGLEAEEMTQLVVATLGARASAQLAATVVQGAQGNPRHADELIRTLRDSGVLRRQLGGWEVQGEATPPLGVESAARLRIERLSSQERALLQAAAVVGRTFWDGAVAALLGEVAGVELGLALLSQRGVAIGRAESRYPGQKEYDFASDAAREIAYQGVDPEARRRYHLRAARWFRQRERRGEVELALAAHHLEEGGERRQAGELYGAAADAAQVAGGYLAADGHYLRALALAEGDPEQLFSLLARRERVLNALGRWREQLQAADRMLSLAREDDSPRQLLEAQLRVGRARLNLGDYDAARAALEDAESLCRDGGDQAARARVLRWQAMVHFNRGEHHRALPIFEQALAAAVQAGRADLEAELAYELGVTVGTVGDYCRALTVSHRALEVFRSGDDRYQQAFCLGNIGCFHGYLGEYDVAVTALEEAVRLGHELAAPLAEAAARANLGNALLGLEQPEAAIAEQRQARRLARRIGDKQLVVDTLVYQAKAVLQVAGVGGVGVATSLLERALDAAREGGLRAAEASALGLQARIALQQGGGAQAVALARGATAILEELGGVEGGEHPIRAVLAESLAAAGEQQAALAAARRAHQALLERAAWIPDPHRRERFLALPAHADLLALIGRLEAAA